MRRAVVLSLVTAFLACGGGDAPTSVPSIPDVAGQYQGTWTAEAESGGQQASNTCPGNITIDSQSGNDISGSFLIDAAGDCTEVETGTVDGSVNQSGGVSFTATNSQGSALDEFASQGCTVVAGDDAFAGSVDGGVLEASAGATLSCTTSSGTVDVDVTVRFSGQ